MRITLTGATGFLGSRLSASLARDGHDLVYLSRRRASRPGFFAWDPLGGEPPTESLACADAVIHLAGEPVAQRWTAAARQLIRQSRVVGTERLVQALSTLSPRPQVLICASATGYYGDRGEETLEESSPPGRGFLPEVCIAWERSASLARALGIRVVSLRFGVVLGREGGALPRMLPAFKAGLAGPLAGGRQWMPWIHIDDAVSLIAWTLSTPTLSGPINAVAPEPERNAGFTHLLARQLHRPAFFPVPGPALRLLFGEMAEVLTSSQRVAPRAALDSGFGFKYPHLAPALASLL